MSSGLPRAARRARTHLGARGRRRRASAPGAAGLAAALAARPVRSVLIVTKDTLDAGSTAWAQGGLAGVLDPADSLEDHVRDTLAAGAGLCDEGVVRELVAEAPKAIRYLMRLGAAFDPSRHERPSRRSPARAGTATTASSTPAATAAGPRCSARSTSRRWRPASRCSTAPSPSTSSSARRPTVRRQAAGVRVALLDADGGVDVGRHGHGPRRRRSPPAATGQVFASTSNPPAVTGDGVALALRAGLAVQRRRVRPVPPDRAVDRARRRRPAGAGQRGGARRGRDPLRRRRRPGDGRASTRSRTSPLATSWRRRSAGAWPQAPGGVDDHVFLDATHLGERFYERFPSITAACRAHRHRPGPRPHPGRPRRPLRVRRRAGPPRRRHRAAAASTRSARCACTGVHGANRLASNSLTEGDRRRHPPRARPGVGAARPRRGRTDGPEPGRRPDRRRPPHRGPGGDVAPRRRAPRRRVARGRGRRRSTP